MDPKRNLLRNVVVRLLLFCLLAIFFRFAYVVTLRGESCDDVTSFCFFPNTRDLVIGVPQLLRSSAVVSDNSANSIPSRVKSPRLWSTKPWKRAVKFYSTVFQDLIGDDYVSPGSKSLCLETPNGEDVFALREIGISDSTGVYKKAAKPLVVSEQAPGRLPFGNNTFDFIFSGGGRLDRSAKQAALAAEVARTLKPKGLFVVHTVSKDEYCFNSFIHLFDFCELVASREMEGFDPSMPNIHQIVMRKYSKGFRKRRLSSGNKCSVPGYKRGLVRKAEPLILEEPLKPWITLKRNIQNVKYLPSMADINFKERYVYVDVGARSYGSSIGSWFKKQYPKQNKTFDIYAIEADKTFYEEYMSKKKVTLLPYAAWVKNETLLFEVNHDSIKEEEEKAKGKGMGRIKPVQSSEVGGASSGVEIEGFDFADWLRRTVTEKDFVVMKMDVEGTEFDLIPRLFETGAICLIDEIFLECHYNRWQRCCPGERSAKYQKTYGQCLDLFTSLRKGGVLVHQWW